MHSMKCCWSLFTESWMPDWLCPWENGKMGKWENREMDKIRTHFVTCTLEKCDCEIDKGISEGGKMPLRI